MKLDKKRSDFKKNIDVRHCRGMGCDLWKINRKNDTYIH
jgi:hypothetical protein